MPKKTVNDSSSDEDEQWSPSHDDDEAIPGFEHLQMIGTLDSIEDEEDAMSELFLGRDPKTSHVFLIKVDHEQEESVELSGSECDLLRKELCSSKGMDASIDKETALAVWLAEVGDVPTALADFDKVASEKKKRQDAEDEEGFTEVPMSDSKEQHAVAKKEVSKKKPAAAKKKQSKLMATSSKKGEESKKVPSKKKEAPKKEESKKKEAEKILPKDDKAEEKAPAVIAPTKKSTPKEAPASASDTGAKKAPPKKKVAPKRKRDDESPLEFMAKKEKSDDVGSSSPFDWQLTLNGKSLASLRAALSALPPM